MLKKKIFLDIFILGKKKIKIYNQKENTKQMDIL